ncbi:apoptosis inhibitor 5-like protein API5 [Silene latifolia]|uniref:apoptosis inhibitor 5-like protein API5 n=1 Tax=Silene latifolia TaxID=37657 RepID=UPI003D77C86F
MSSAAAATVTTTTTTTTSAESTDIENLYGFGDRLSQAKDKSQNVKDYEGIIMAAKGGTTKAKQLAAQLIPRFFHYFPQLHDTAANAHFDLCEEEDIGVRVQAIRGLPLFCKDTPEFVSRIVDLLAQLLMAEENVERDAVQKALMSLLRQDVKASVTALFKHVESVDESTDENIRDKVLTFIRDKVFSLKAELLKPREQMERHITDLIKKSLRDVTGGEFKMFIDFLKTLSIFSDKAPRERVQELMEIIESQADLDSQFNASDVDHIDRLISCLYIAIPFFIRGASNSKFLNYVSEHIVPVLDKLPEERKLDLLKNLAESSPHTIPQDARRILPSIVQLLKKYMPQKKTGEEMNFTYVECLLYTFHHLASKTPNATNSLCGYKIVTGQPSDRIGEDFSEQFKDFTERLTCVEDLSRATVKKLTQGMNVQNKRMATASNEVKEKIKNEKQNTAAGLKTCNNILAMTQPLHKNSPLFIGDKRIILSWKEDAKSAVSPVTGGSGGKRPASTAINGSNNNAAKKGRGAGGSQNQLVSRAFDSIGYRGRGGSRGGRGRGWGGRGRGRSFRQF